MLRDAYKPGDRVPKPESYWVNHYQHRTTHLSHVSSPRFPICVECGDKVRFEPAAVENEQAASISDDRDFFPQP